jgi:hypothetical protein
MELIKRDGIYYIVNDGIELEKIRPHPMESVIDYTQRAEKYLDTYNYNKNDRNRTYSYRETGTD